jgi:hypothetical protein
MPSSRASSLDAATASTRWVPRTERTPSRSSARAIDGSSRGSAAMSGATHGAYAVRSSSTARPSSVRTRVVRSTCSPALMPSERSSPAVGRSQTSATTRPPGWRPWLSAHSGNVRVSANSRACSADETTQPLPRAGSTIPRRSSEASALRTVPRATP